MINVILRKQRLSAINCTRFNQQRDYSGLRPLPVVICKSVDNNYNPRKRTIERNFSIKSLTEQDGVTKYMLEAIMDSKFTWMLAEKMVWVHDGLGLPWWSVIILASISSRLVVFPLLVYSQKVIARRKLAYLEVEKEMPQVKYSTTQLSRQKKLSFDETRRTFHLERIKLVQKTIIKYNCANLKIFAPAYVQLPFFLSFNAAIRKVSNGDELMMTEGPMFMTNLTLPVETWILPLFVGSLFWLSLQVNLSQASKMQAMTSLNSNRTQTIVRYFVNGLILVMVYFCGQVESGLALYWASSAASAYASNLVLISPRVLRQLGIPRFENDPKHPYRTYGQFLAQKFKLVK